MKMRRNKHKIISDFYNALGGRDGLEIILLEYPKWTVYRGKECLDSFHLNAVERRIIYKHLSDIN